MADVKVRVISEYLGGQGNQKFVQEMDAMRKASDNTSKAGQTLGERFSGAVKSIGTFTAAAGIATSEPRKSS